MTDIHDTASPSPELDSHELDGARAMHDVRRATTEAELGLVRRTSVAVRSNLARANSPTLAREMQDEGARLLTARAPQTLGEHLRDFLAPSAAVAERKRMNTAVMRQEADYRIAVHAAITDAKVHEIQKQAEVHMTGNDLAAAEAIAQKAMETAGRVEAEIKAAGADFDRGLDAEIKRVLSLETGEAQQAAMKRVDGLSAMHAEIERATMENVADAVRGSPRGRRI